MTPQARPSWFMRALFGMAAICGLMFAGALMWSDRAPGAVRAVLGPRAAELWARIDASERVRSLRGNSLSQTDFELPQTDFVLHAVLWAAVTFLVIATLWRWAGLVVGSIGIFAVSVLIEVGQQRYTSTRTVAFQDVVGNALGVAIGAVAAGICFLLWSAVAAVFGRAPRRYGARYA